jgi:hypothetical protein
MLLVRQTTRVQRRRKEYRDMNPFALYLVATIEMDNLRNESPRRFLTPEVDREAGPSVLQRIRAAFASHKVDAPAATPALLDYPYRS